MIDRRSVLAALAAAPFAARAAAGQTLPLVAILSPVSSSAGSIKLVIEPFKQALNKLGYAPGRTIGLAERFADGDESRLPALAAELVALQPRVMFTHTAAASTAAAAATRTIPIVVGAADEIVLIRLAGEDMARPTTNVTGFALTSPMIEAKCLALLMEAAPEAKPIGVLVNPHSPAQRDYPAPLNAALGISEGALVRLESSGLADIDAALASAASARIGALFIATDALLADHPDMRARILRFAAGKNIPVVSAYQNFARDGALIAMGPSFLALAIGAAGYVDKILKGAKIAYLPVQRPSVFTTIINLKTAKALGLTVPLLLLARADEVIE